MGQQSIPMSQRLQTSITSWWKHDDEASGLAEDSLARNHLSGLNTPNFTTGVIGLANTLVASSSQRFIKSSPDGLRPGAFNNSNFSFSFWFQLKNPTATLDIGIGDWNLYVETEWRVTIATSGAVFEVSSDGATGTYLVGTSSLSVDTWYHVVAINSPEGGLYIFLNGVLADAWTGSGVYVGTYDFQIGNNGGLVFSDAWVDLMGFWNKALTPAEVSALYNNGNGLDYPFTGA